MTCPPFVACSTCRIWHVDDAAKSQRHVVKPRATGGLKTHPSACTYSRDGHLVAAACTDGSLQMWDHRKAYVSRRAHCGESALVLVLLYTRRWAIERLALS